MPGIMRPGAGAGRAADCPGRAFGHVQQLRAIGKACGCKCVVEIGSTDDAGGVGEIGACVLSRCGISDDRNVLRVSPSSITRP